MGIISRMAKQAAIYWPQVGVDQNGKPTLGSPSVIACRWEDKVGEALTPTGQTVVTGAVVYVLQDVTTGGKLWLIAGVTTPPLPSLPALPPLNTVWEIVHFSKNPTYSARAFVRTAMLAR